MFHPWIGLKWGQPGNALGGTRLLIVGQIPLLQPRAPRVDWPVLARDDGGRRRGSCHQRGASLLHGSDANRIRTSKVDDEHGRDKGVWHALAFYNYVPMFVGDRPRVRPTRSMFESGRTPFGTVLHRLAPQTIIVCGQDLWWWLRRGIQADVVTAPSPAEECRIGPAQAIRITHPSAIGFSSTKTRPIVERLLTQVANA